MWYSAPLSSNPKINVEGLVFVAEPKFGQLILPSSKNYFGTFKVPKLMVDDGCSTMLIVLEDPTRIDDIFESFQPETHHYTASRGYGSGGEAVAFEVTKKNSKMLFPLHFCRDLLPSVPSLSVDMILFALNTTAEIQYMVEKHGDKLQSGTLKFLEEQARLHRSLKSSLKYSLIGFKLLEKVGVVRKGRVQYYFDPDKCTLVDFKAVSEQDARVQQHLAFKTSPAQLKELAEEMRDEQVARRHGDFAERASLVLWEEELPFYGKELETAVIDDDEDEGTVCIYNCQLL
jgi:hypothetical protein